MANGTAPVSTQWALEGKQLDGEGYRVLACSTGDLNRANFADALSRFRVGELPNLPQVSVSYARLGTQPVLSYQALAIHWYATEGQRYASDVSPRDGSGRATTNTSYFCLPYQPLADAGIGYIAMYEALSAVTLDVADGPPITVPVALPTSRIPAATDLAVRVAPLLLTGRRVCVLGAEDTSLRERLEFIDTVMQLLPYGLRARMTAATWMRATNRDHGFRLFFSNAPGAGGTDHEVDWDGDPELVRVTHARASEYLEWLQDNLGQLTRLTELTNEMQFTAKTAALQAVEAATGTRHLFHTRSRPAAASKPGQPAQAPDAGEEALYNCAEYLKLGNGFRLRGEVRLLRRFADSEIDAPHRKKYQDLMTRLGLLRYDSSTESKNERLYEPLIRLAFGAPLNYAAYCRLEACAGLDPGDAPDKELLTAIAKIGVTGPAVRAIVHWHLGHADEKRLGRSLARLADPVVLIHLLARQWKYSQHAKIVCDVTLEILRQPRGRDEQQQVRDALLRHGFLARALQLCHPDNEQYQLDTLSQFLAAAYPQPTNTPGQDLSRAAIVSVLSRASGPPPTPALLGAVMLKLQKPEARQLAMDAFIRGCLIQGSLDAGTLGQLADRLPAIDSGVMFTPKSLPNPTGQDMSGQFQGGPSR